MDRQESNTSAILAPSLVDLRLTSRPSTKPRRQVQNEAAIWQLSSQTGAWAEIAASSIGTRRRRSKPKAPYSANRIIEIHGIIGAIGEQLGLAWTSEQDVQRMRKTARYREVEHNTLIQRALAEVTGHFVLGASHSTANLILRTLIINQSASKYLVSLKRHKNAAGFVPGSDDRFAWLTLNQQMTTELDEAAKLSGNRFMVELANVLNSFRQSSAFVDLDARRGMDYHRRRPQSVAHTSPRTGNVTFPSPGVTAISMLAPIVEPEADADQVHDIVTAAMGELVKLMRATRVVLPKAVRAERIPFTGYSRLPRPRKPR